MPHRGRFPFSSHLGRVFAPLVAAALVAGCGLGKTETAYPTELPGKQGRPDHSGKPREGLFGPDGIVLFGGTGTTEGAQPGTGIGVNSFLWRASLDTISFMPLVSADPFGGVIISDWYSPPEVQEERFKVTIYILGRDLRADGVRAAVFRQRLNEAGAWVDTVVENQTPVDLENAILTRARQLRIAGLE